MNPDKIKDALVVIASEIQKPDKVRQNKCDLAIEYMMVYGTINQPTALSLGIKNLPETIRLIRKKVVVFTERHPRFGTHYALGRSQ